MERKRNLMSIIYRSFASVLILLLITMVGSAKSTINSEHLSDNLPSTYKSKAYDAFINGDMGKWLNLIIEMESDIVSLNGKPAENDVKRELLNYYYGYTAFLISKEQMREASTYAEKGEKIIEMFLAKQPQNAEMLAYKAAFKGFKIGISKFKAVTLGMQSQSIIKKAYALSPGNIRVLIERGNILFYSPKMFGGNKREAIQMYKKAASALESRGDTVGNWEYLNLLTVIAQALLDTDNKNEAINLYKKLLILEPRFKWAQEKLKIISDF